MFFKQKKTSERVQNASSQDVIQVMLDQASARLKAGNPEQAFSTYKQVVQLQANVTAQYNLGILYTQGLGTGQDFMEAAYWFHQAANSGDKNAEKLCSKAILDYVHQDLNVKSSRDIYEKMSRLAAYVYPQEDRIEIANSKLYGIAGLHFNRKEYAVAAKLFRAAAEFGNHAMSANYLAVLYNAGAGVEKNDLAALYWFDKAADCGVEAAKTDRNGILNAYKSNLSKADFVEQMDLLASWCSMGTAMVPKDAPKAKYWRQTAQL